MLRSVNSSLDAVVGQLCSTLFYAVCLSVCHDDSSGPRNATGQLRDEIMEVVVPTLHPGDSFMTGSCQS